jgi:mono/diheme cytochrome c family protein
MKTALSLFVAASVLVMEILSAVGVSAQPTASRGIGPVKELKLGPVDRQVAEAGRKIFETKCAMCHALDTKKLAPPLRNVTVQRTPEWIMNLLLNVKEMLASDPAAQEMRSQYSLPMPDQQLTQDSARQILEYLRQAATEKK